MSDLSLLIISGLSGAGKTSSANVLEDLGYNVICNPPLSVLDRITELLYTSDSSKVLKVAFVVDSRSNDIELLSKMISMMKDSYNATVIFLDASEDTLVKRYKETRRKHPQGDDIVDGIKKEITLMRDIKDMADIVFNSDNKSIHDLMDNIHDYFKDYIAKRGLFITLQSFGFKYGVPMESDIMFDVRFLANPFFEVSLKHKTGLDDEVKEYVMADSNYQTFIDKLSDMLLYSIPLYERENKKYLSISIGCTGGKHRSVTVVENLEKILKTNGQSFVHMKHRDIEKK